jgi:methionyl aminopeptidase
MKVRDNQDRKALRKIGQIVGQVLHEMIAAARPGMTTLELDQLGRDLLARQGARSAPILLYNFPGATCISVAPAVAHGIPDQTVLQAGDLVNVDVSAELNEYFGDCGASFVVPGSESELARQREVHIKEGREIFDRIVGSVRADLPFFKLGQIMQQSARAKGYTMIRNLCSHGVGRHLHEEPRYILPFPDFEDKRKIEKDLVITIEPFISKGSEEIIQSSDGWTLIPRPAVDTVQFEHSMIVKAGGVELLTLP